MGNIQNTKWYFTEWMDHLSFAQHTVTKLTGWQKNKTNRLFHGTQPFTSNDIADLSRIFQIRPYELLLPPPVAIKIRDITYPLLSPEQK